MSIASQVCSGACCSSATHNTAHGELSTCTCTRATPNNDSHVAVRHVQVFPVANDWAGLHNDRGANQVSARRVETGFLRDTTIVQSACAN
jgi:hypothetical protein